MNSRCWQHIKLLLTWSVSLQSAYSNGKMSGKIGSASVFKELHYPVRFDVKSTSFTVLQAILTALEGVPYKAWGWTKKFLSYTQHGYC